MKKLLTFLFIPVILTACQSTPSQGLTSASVISHPTKYQRDEPLPYLLKAEKNTVPTVAALPHRASTNITYHWKRASRSRFHTNVIHATGSSVWYRLADCESGEWQDGGASFVRNSAKWNDTEGQFEGGLQFDPGTWRAYGGTKYAAHAYDASPAEQIEIAIKVQADQGWNAWPVCSRKVGLQ